MLGKLVVVEGTDGSGKATQSGFLVRNLKKHGYNAVLVSFPRYNSFFGKLAKQYLEGKFGSKEKAPLELSALFFSLDRYDFKLQLEKMLNHGKIVVCNRYSYSNFAHMAAKIKNRKQQQVFLEWIESVESRLPVPKIKIFLDMPVSATGKLLRERARKKNSKADLHEQDASYLERTRRVYLEIVKKEKNWVLVECAKKSGDGIKVLSPAEISKIIWGSLKDKV